MLSHIESFDLKTPSRLKPLLLNALRSPHDRTPKPDTGLSSPRAAVHTGKAFRAFWPRYSTKNPFGLREAEGVAMLIEENLSQLSQVFLATNKSFSER